MASGSRDPQLAQLPPPAPGTAAFLAPPPYLPPTPGEHDGALKDERRSGRGRLVLALVAVVVLGLISVVALLVLKPSEELGPVRPAAWDPRVTELVGFVERERGLTFKHPVFVDVIDAADIARSLRSSDIAPSGETLNALLAEASMLRAVGLHQGEVDLHASGPAPSAADVTAVYDPITERLAVPDREMDPRLRADVVHELTHVLHHQHFGTRIGQSAAVPTSVATLAEGDANRIEQRYIEQLPASEQAELAALAALAAPSDAPVGSPVGLRHRSQGASNLEALRLTPKVLGPALVTMLRDIDEQVALDAGLAQPAASDEALIDPSHYRGNGSVRVVPAPTAVAGEVVQAEGALGPLVWYLMFAQHNTPGVALQAAYGWGGDRYVLVKSGEQACLRANFRGDLPQDAVEFLTAAQAWAATAPAGARREVTKSGDQVTVTACDPGPDAPSVAVVDPVITLASVRLVLEYSVRVRQEQDLSYAQARCVAQTVVSQLSLEQVVLVRTLTSAELLAPEIEADLDNRAAAALTSCG
ncbi:MAG: hypothetical protein ACKV2O_18310 [Acidimicrobiales bacterium]